MLHSLRVESAELPLVRDVTEQSFRLQLSPDTVCRAAACALSLAQASIRLTCTPNSALARIDVFVDGELSHSAAQAGAARLCACARRAMPLQTSRFLSGCRPRQASSTSL